MRLRSTAQLYHCPKCRSLRLDIISVLLEILHIIFRLLNYNLKITSCEIFPFLYQYKEPTGRAVIHQIIL